MCLCNAFHLTYTEIAWGAPKVLHNHFHVGILFPTYGI